jgi:hypothetical protein
MCFLALFIVLEEYGGRVGNDGTMLYIYVRSMVIDGDLDLTNEFEDFVPEKFQNIAQRARRRGVALDPGNELGPAFFWLPFFLAAHVMVRLGFGPGFEIAADGYSFPYINAVCLGSLLWAFGGVIISSILSRRYFSSDLVAWCAVALWLATPLYWYSVHEPSMSHAIATFTVSLFLLAWLVAWEKGSFSHWLLVAFAAGLMLSVQRYNVYLFLAPGLTLLGLTFRSLSTTGAEERRKILKIGGLSLLVLLVASSPFWLYNLMLEGSIIRHGDLPRNAIGQWRNPSFFQLLFSSNHGLFAWTPAAYLSVIGLFVFLKRERRVAGVLLLTLLGGVYLLSSNWDWKAGFAFGARRLTEAFPIFLLGFCSFVVWARRSPRFLLSIPVVGLILWNLGLAGQRRRDEIPPMGTFSFSDAASRNVSRFYERVGHPSSVPANWIFAWIYGVTPDRFDEIFGHRAYHNLTVDVGSSADRFVVGKGWARPERLPDGRSFRWSDGPESSWLVHLFQDRPFDYRMRIVGESVPRGSESPQRIDVWVNKRPAGVLTLAPTESAAELRVPERFWNAGLNEIVFRYAFTSRADEIYGGSDPRRLGVRIEQFGLLIDN